MAERWRKEKLEWLEWPVPFWATSRARAAEALVSLFNGEDDMLVELAEIEDGDAAAVTATSDDPEVLRARGAEYDALCAEITDVCATLRRLDCC